MSVLYFPNQPSLGDFLGSLRGRSVAVVGHPRPDADCVGASLAFAYLLQERGVEVCVVNEDVLPEVFGSYAVGLSWIEAARFERRDCVAVAVDVPVVERLGVCGALFTSFVGRVDHHVGGDGDFGLCQWVDSGAAASCELIAALILDSCLPLSERVARALYLGLVGDTGFFRFSNVSERVFRVAAELVRAGARAQEADWVLNAPSPLCRQKLLGLFLRSLSLEADGQLCVGSLSLKDYLSSGASRCHSEGFVDYARAVSGVRVGLFLEELGQGWLKGSLRARVQDFRLDRLAGVFGGGGHRAASGFKLRASLDSFLPRFVEAFQVHDQSLR